MGYVGQAPAAGSVTTSDITDGTIANADIASDAAIAMSKTALSAGTNITLSTNTLNVDDAFLTNTGNDTTSGVLTVSNSTAASATNTGAFVVTGGIATGGDIWVGDDIVMDSDSAVLSLGDGQDVTLTHDGTTGATLAGNPITITAAGASSWTTSAGALTISGKTGVNFQEDGATIIGISDARAVSTTNTASIDLDASGAIQINSSGGALSIGNDNVDQAVNIATAGTRTLNIGINDGTDLTTTNAYGIFKLGGTAEAHDYGTEHSGYGITLTMEAGETLTLGQAVYVDSNGKAQHPDVDASSVTGKPAIGIAMTGASSGASVNVMVLGIFRDATYDFSPGAAVIMTGTDGALTTTAGDTAADGDIVQRVGIAITADMLFVMPSIDEIEHA